MDIFNFFLDKYYNFVFWLYSPKVAFFVYIAKIISFIISAALFSAIFVLVYKKQIIQNKINIFLESARKRPKISRKGEILQKWNKIKERLENQKEAECRLAVIEADKLFDDFLIRIGYKGNDMGERLNTIDQSQLSVIDDIWRSHRIRNAIVHKPDFKLNCEEAADALKAYEKAFKEFELF